MKPKPLGLGIPSSHRSLAHFLLVAHGVSHEQSAAMAVGIYAAHKAVMALKEDRSLNANRLLRMAARGAIQT